MLQEAVIVAMRFADLVQELVTFPREAASERLDDGKVEPNFFAVGVRHEQRSEIKRRTSVVALDATQAIGDQLTRGPVSRHAARSYSTL